MGVKKVTAVLLAAEIAPCIEFWQQVGYSATVEVPHGDKLGFVILTNGSSEIMYQTPASVAEDVPPLAGSPQRGTFLYVEVDDVNAVERTLTNAERVVPRRKTFYGADEIIVREPGGNVVAFAQMQAG